MKLLMTSQLVTFIGNLFSAIAGVVRTIGASDEIAKVKPILTIFHA
tara:strand:- start:433 stop:570 length:138 start_codon:yes stop_codon:yes gene_type:complete